MTIGNQTEEVREAEGYDQLVTPEFAPLADFAGFRAYEAVAVQETGRNITAHLDRIPEAISAYLMTRPESAPLVGESHLPVSETLIKEGINRTRAWPIDRAMTTFLPQTN